MRKLILMFILLLMSLLTFGAPTQDIRYRNISMDEGLRSNTVRTVTQDKYGYMWFGTDAGLCRYDGYHVLYFRIPQNGFDQYISTLKAYHDGLLVGTAKGAYYFDFASQKFTSYLSKVITKQVNSFAFDQDGNVWIATMGQGVFRYQPQLHRCKQFVCRAQQGLIAQVMVDANNQIWMMTNWGAPAISKLDKAKDVFQPSCFNSSIQEYGGLTMLQSKDGKIWIGTWNHGLLLLKDGDLLEQVVNPHLTGVGHHIHTLYENGPDCILIGCDDGVVCYNPQTQAWRLIADNEQGAESLHDKFVYSIVQDHEGGLWFGTFYGGVNYLSPVGERFTRFGNGENHYYGNVVGRFCEDNYGHVWIASDDNGLACFSLKSNAIVDYPGSKLLSGYNVHGLLADGRQLWIGTYTNGLICYDIVTGQMRRYTEQDGLDGNSSYAIFRDRRHRLWAATFDAIFLLNEQKQRFEYVHRVNGIPIDVDEDRQGNIWWATQGDGIHRYNSASHTWQHDLPSQQKNALPSYQINALHMDNNGVLWIATMNGLCWYHPAKKCYERVSMALPTQEINGVLEDQGVLWLGTTMGIAKYTKDGKVQLFTRFDGLVNDQYQPNACLKASDGRIFFGSIRGFNTFYPYQIQVNQVEPIVKITELKLMNKPQLVGTDKLKQSLDHIEQLDLSYSDDMFSLSFASLSYCSPEKNHYAYRLEGFDKGWNEVGSQHEATYTNIPAGTYMFQVKATNNDGVWSKQMAQLKIVVHPPFWLSLPAKIFYVILVIFLVFEISQFRLKRAERKHQQQIKAINVKREQETREARLRFFTMIAHEIRTPVTLIIGPLEQFLQKLKDKTIARECMLDEQGELRVIERNAHRLLDLVNQLLDFNKVQQPGLELHFSLQNIQALMQEVVDRFVPTLNQKHIHLDLVMPPADFSALVDAEGMTKVLSNLMANATKYTQDRIRLACRISPDKRYFELEVANNGPAIRASEQENIFHPFYQASDNKPGTGIGLSIVLHIVQLHHGQIRVESQEQAETRFMVTLPVYQSDAIIGTEKSSSVHIETDTSMAQQTALTLSDEATQKKPSVLIVEDDEDMNRFIASHFQQHYQVLTASQGKEALQQVAHHTISLIVSDWMMPEMDGAEFCRRIRADQNTSHIPFIMLTAKTDDDSKTQGVECGADVYIEKPFSMKYLEASIHHLLDMRKLLMEKFSHSPSMSISQIAASPIDDDLLSRMNQLIEDNIDNPDLSVQFLATHLNISRSSLFAKIKSLTDSTPNEIIQVVRLRQAAKLLQEGKYRINEICFMVGFNSPSYFSKCFQKQFGVKPGEYR